MAKEKSESTEQQLRERFNTDLETAKRFMDPIHLLMDKYYEQYRNRNTASSDCKFKISDLYGYVETVVPILTNNRVRATVKSDYPKYIRHAQGLTDILDHSYDINNWDYEAQEIARMAEIYRSAIAYSGYDGDYKNGTGKICMYGCNIRWCYLDPGASKFDESSFFFYVEPKRKTEVFKLHPDKKVEIEESIGKRNALEKTDSKVRRWFQTLIMSVKNYLAFNMSNMTAQPTTPFYDELQELDEEEKRRNSVAYIHQWYRDDDDKWRVAFWADDVFLKDMENPFWHGQLPYDIYNPTKDILSSMGIPMGEHIENLNWEKNVLMDLIVQSAKRAVDPPLLYNTAAGLKDPQALREKAKNTGTIPLNNPEFVPLNAIADFVNLPQLPAWVDALPERFDAMEDRITGVSDTFRGIGDATSGKEVQLKQEAAYTRIKTKIDNFELFQKSVAGKLIVNAMQHYGKTRGFRIKGDYRKYAQNGQIPQDMPFDVEPVQNGMNPDTGEATFDRSEYYLYANPNEWTKIEQPEAPADVQEGVPETVKKGEPTEEKVKHAYRILQMTVEIEAGSSLPQSRMARREEALDLYGAQAIDQEALLDSYDWPNRDEVMKRMAEAAKTQQEAEMQAKQAESQQQMEMKRMELEAKTNMQQMGNDAKLQQQLQGQGQGQAPMQGQPDIASQLDALRQMVPQLAQASDEQIMQLLARMGQPQGQPQMQVG